MNTATSQHEPKEWPWVGIVIVTHNLKDTLRETLDSCFKIDYPRFKVVVCDNASSDGTLEMLRTEFPSVQVIANPVGLGYAEAASQGMEALAGECQYLFSTSNDVTFDPAILRGMVAAMEADKQIGVLGSKVYFFDRPDIIWHAGAHVSPWHGHSYHYGWERKDHPRYDHPRACDYVTGCGYMVRSDVAKKLGFLKTDLVFYFEDADLCYRVRAAGYKVLYLPRAKVWHKTSTTLAKNRGRQLRYSTRNNLFLLAQHRVGPCYPFTLLAHLLVVLPVKALLFLMVLRWKNAVGIWQGIKDWRQGRYGMITD